MDDEKKVPESAQEIKADNEHTKHSQHLQWVKEELNEEKKEKKKAFGFQKKFIRALDMRKKAMFGGKFTHGIKGKPTHGPRGNQG